MVPCSWGRGSRPGSAARGVRQEQRGAGACGGWKRPEGVRGNKADVGTMWVGAAATEPALRPGWALLPGPGGARAAGPNAAAVRRPLSPAQGRGSPSSPPPSWP